MLYLATGTPGAKKTVFVVSKLDKVERDNKVNLVKNKEYYAFNKQFIDKFRSDFGYYESDVGSGHRLKNVIDVASRPYKENVWTAKKVAVVTASPSTYGARDSGLDVRKSMQMLAAQMMISPEVYLGNATDSIDDAGEISERTQKYLQRFVDAFVIFAGNTSE